MDFVYYSALDLAKYVINKCIEEDQPISNFILQKILYLIQLTMLQETGNLAYCDDTEAWQWGPVVPDVYYGMCTNGALPIIMPYKVEEEPSGCEKAIIDRVVEENQALSPYLLQEEIERDGSPWKKTYNNGEGNKKVIPISMMYNYVRPSAKITDESVLAWL